MKFSVGTTVDYLLEGVLGDRLHRVFNDGKEIQSLKSRAYSSEGGIKVRAFNPQQIFFTEEFSEGISDEILTGIIEKEILKSIVSIYTYGAEQEDSEAIKTVKFVGALPKTFTLHHMITINMQKVTVLCPLETTFSPQPDLTVQTHTSMQEDYDFGPIVKRSFIPKRFDDIHGSVTADMTVDEMLKTINHQIWTSIT